MEKKKKKPDLEVASDIKSVNTYKLWFRKFKLDTKNITRRALQYCLRLPEEVVESVLAAFQVFPGQKHG